MRPQGSRMTDAPPAHVKSESEDRKGRKGTRHARRLQLIESTIDSLAARGYAETTLADVAKGAGLSRGIVNFYFESKEKLLVATLQHMAEEYSTHWRSALAKASSVAVVMILLIIVPLALFNKYQAESQDGQGSAR